VPTVHVVEDTAASADDVLEAARDFTPRRAERWPDVHIEHLHVHETGDGWADVTEGNPWPIGFVWERLRYDWSGFAGALAGVVIGFFFGAMSTGHDSATFLGDSLREPSSAARSVSYSGSWRAAR
jgi:hypothetical protein